MITPTPEEIDINNLKQFLTQPGTDKLRFLLQTLEAADPRAARLFSQLSALRATATVPPSLRTQMMGAIDPLMLQQLAQDLEATDNPTLNNYAVILRAKAQLEKEALHALSAL